MKKSLLVSCAIAGLVLGSQAALANHHEKKKDEEGKSGCKGKDAKEGKSGCNGKAAAEGDHSCGAAGCEGKKEDPKKKK